MLFFIGYVGFIVLLFLTVPIWNGWAEAYFDWVDNKLDEWRNKR